MTTERRRGRRRRPRRTGRICDGDDDRSRRHRRPTPKRPRSRQPRPRPSRSSRRRRPSRAGRRAGADRRRRAEPTRAAEPTPPSRNRASRSSPRPRPMSPPTEPDEAPETPPTPSRAESSAAAAAEPAPEPLPAPARTVGRFIADALRAAGVRYAFTVPGESFLGLLEGLDAAGIRVVATRHEGAAAFMAEAHGQLTGRPAACRRHARRRRREPRDRHPHRAPGLDADVRPRRPGRARAAWPGGVPGGRPGRRRSAGSPRAPRSRASAAEVPAAVGDAIRAALVGRPGPVLLSLPEDLLDEVLPEGTQLDTVRPAPPRPEPDDVRAVLQFARRPRAGR